MLWQPFEAILFWYSQIWSFFDKNDYFGAFWDSRGPENFFYEKILAVIVDHGCMSYFLLIKRRSGSLLNCFYPLLSHFSQIWPFWVRRLFGGPRFLGIRLF